jgi:PST family polysaccharide transporter
MDGMAENNHSGTACEQTEEVAGRGDGPVLETLSGPQAAVEPGVELGTEKESEQPLLDRTVRAVGWQFATVFGKYVLQFLVVAVLSRLLTPADFGLVSQAMIFVGLANLFADIGVAPALIQRKTITDRHIRVAFTFSMLTGVVMAAVAWVTAWIPAMAFRNESLEPLLQFLSITLLFKSAGLTASCLLMRRLNFRSWFWSYIVASVVGSACVGITLAVAGYGAWALAWAYVAQDGLACVILLIVVRHPMRFLLARAETGQLLGYGVGITLSKVVHYGTQTLDQFVIGRWLGAAPLGLYSRAFQLVTISNETFAQVLGRVLFPAFSKMQDDTERLRNAYLRAVSTVALLGFPIFAGLAVVAPEAVLFVFGSQWGGTVIPLQILCVGGLFWSVTTLSDQIAHATAAVYHMFRRRIVLAVAILGGALLGAQFGINGVAVGVASSQVLMYFIMARLSLQLTGGDWFSFAACQLPGVGVTALIAIGSHAVATALRANGTPVFVTLLLTVSAGMIIGVAAVLGMPRSKVPDNVRWSLEKIDEMIAKVAVNLQGRGLPVPFMAGRLNK